MMMPADTRATLLLRIRDPRNAEAWREFMAIYEPFIAAVAIRFGLQSADADELTQDVFITVLEKQQLYAPNGQPHSFRRWLATVARNAAIARIRKRNPERYLPSGGTEAIQLLHNAIDPSSSPISLELQYQKEERAFLLGWAADQVRTRIDPKSWDAFWLTSIEGLSPQETATKLGLSVGHVYVSRCRILKRLRETVQQYVDDTSSKESSL